MSEKNGKLTTCDVCGATVFSEYTGSGETDGGYTRWNKFEPKPDGWSWESDLGHLCPKCSDRFKCKWEQLKKEMKEEAKA